MSQSMNQITLNYRATNMSFDLREGPGGEDNNYQAEGRRCVSCWAWVRTNQRALGAPFLDRHIKKVSQLIEKIAQIEEPAAAAR
jgi:hypothetical protein